MLYTKYTQYIKLSTRAKIHALKSHINFVHQIIQNEQRLYAKLLSKLKEKTEWNFTTDQINKRKMNNLCRIWQNKYNILNKKRDSEWLLIFIDKKGYQSYLTFWMFFFSFRKLKFLSENFMTQKILSKMTFFYSRQRSSPLCSRDLWTWEISLEQPVARAA